MPGLRVAYDVTPVLTGRTGIARYVTQLGAGLVAAGVDVRRYGVGRAAFAAPEATRHLRVPLRIVERSWSLGGPPRVERLTGPVDVVHSTSLIVPRTRRPLLVTIYDTGPLDHPELHPARAVESFRRMLRNLPRAATVLTLSHAGAADLARHGVDPERITVVYLGRAALPPPRPVEVGGPFVLTVGEQVPRKDQATLVRAFARADLGDVRLALVGPPGPATPVLQTLARDLGVEGRVRFLGAVDDAALAWLYGNALAYCVPSVSEGYGIPIVEAMAAGLPVVASEIPTTVELAGGVALLHAVGDDATLAAGLEQVVHDGALRDRLGAQGRARAAGHTWERTAHDTLAAYERALGR